MYSQTKKNKAEWIAIGSLLFSILLSIPLTNFLFLYPSSMVCLLGWVFFISVFRASQSAKYVGRPFSQLLLVPFESLRRLTYELLKGEDPVQIKVAAEKFCGFAFLFTGFCLTNNIINESDINGALFSYVLSFLPAGIFACRAAKIMHRPSFVLFLEFFGFKIPKILKCKPPFYLHCRFHPFTSFLFKAIKIYLQEPSRLSSIQGNVVIRHQVEKNRVLKSQLTLTQRGRPVITVINRT